MSKLRLIIGIPAYGGQITANHARMWLEIGNTLGGSYERFSLVEFAFWDVNGIDQARNMMLARALELQADWLLMIDADTWIEPSKIDRESGVDAGFLLLRMISDAERREAAIVVAPVMPRRASATGDQGPMVWVKHPNLDAGCAPDAALLEQRGLFEIDSAATAVFAVNIPRIIPIKPSFKFAGGLSEDKFFCKCVRDGGGKIFVDTRVRTGHTSRTFPIYSDEGNDGR